VFAARINPDLVCLASVYTGSEGLLKNNFPTPELTLHVSSREFAFEGPSRKPPTLVSSDLLPQWLKATGTYIFTGPEARRAFSPEDLLRDPSLPQHLRSRSYSDDMHIRANPGPGFVASGGGRLRNLTYRKTIGIFKKTKRAFDKQL